MACQNLLKTKLITILTSAYIMVGCSSGGTGGGAGAQNIGVVNGDNGIIFSSSVIATDGISVDTVLGVCKAASTNADGTITEEVLEPGLFTKTGTLTISAQSTASLVDPNLFPSGTTFNSYTVTYAKQGDAQAPTLSPRTHAQSITLISGTATVSAPIILFDLGSTHREYSAQNPLGLVYSYQVSVTANGQTLSGRPIVITATTFLEIGNFDLC